MSNVLDKLSNDRIFYVAKEGDRFAFTEACDDYFTSYLTESEVMELANSLIAMTLKGDA